MIYSRYQIGFDIYVRASAPRSLKSLRRLNRSYKNKVRCRGLREIYDFLQRLD
jgi:hypothetical protein